MRRVGSATQLYPSLQSRLTLLAELTRVSFSHVIAATIKNRLCHFADAYFGASLGFEIADCKLNHFDFSI